jgi:protein ImuA
MTGTNREHERECYDLMSSAAQLVDLQERIRRIERPNAMRHGVLPFGVAAIDRALPEGGLALGALHEILGAGSDGEDGAAAAGFAAAIAGRIDNPFVIPGHRAAMNPEPMNTDLSPDFTSPCSWVPGSRAAPSPRNDLRVRGGGMVLWCSKQRDLYGPGLAEHGLDPARIVLVRAARDDDILWALEEGLRTPALAAVVSEVGRLPMVAGRRLQLAAERSGVTALLLRRWRTGAEAAAERTQPSAAVTRWRITSLPSLPDGEPGLGRPRWRVELLRCRGAEPAAWDMPVDLGGADAPDALRLPAKLADRPAAPQRPAAERQTLRAVG